MPSNASDIGQSFREPSDSAQAKGKSITGEAEARACEEQRQAKKRRWKPKSNAAWPNGWKRSPGDGRTRVIRNGIGRSAK
jgi:hypothetical protein